MSRTEPGPLSGGGGGGETKAPRGGAARQRGAHRHLPEARLWERGLEAARPASGRAGGLRAGIVPRERCLTDTPKLV